MKIEGWERAFVEQQRVGRLGTIANDGRPVLVPVCYALVDDETLAIAVDEKPKRTTRLARLANIERDPRVSLLIDHYSDDWEQLAWVRIDGPARVEQRGEAEPEALAALRARYQQYQKMALEALPLIVLAPVRVLSWRYRQ